MHFDALKCLKVGCDLCDNVLDKSSTEKCGIFTV